MDVSAALGALAAEGSEQTRKTFRRHGAPEPMFGVLFSRLRPLAKQIGVDHDLAVALWATGNTDARCLAMMVADPARLDAVTADAWASTAGYHVIADLVAEVVSRSSIAIDRMAAWVGAADEYVGRCGWSVMAQLAVHHPEIADAAFTPYVSVIERRIHEAPNRTREGMNGALISIGGRSDELAAPALAAAARIGPVQIDHGDTACETADAGDYIAKMRARAHAKAGAKKPAPAKKKPAPAKKKPARAKKKPAPAKKKPAPAKKKPAPAKKKPAPAKKRR